MVTIWRGRGSFDGLIKYLLQSILKIKMVKSIEEVLTNEELSQILRIERDMQDIYHARLLGNVLHIECEIIGDEICVELYPSLRNPYLRRIPSKRVKEIPERKDEKELYERRGRHKIEFVGRRHEIVLDEIRMRNHDIEVHKYFLSEKEGYDVGWIIAAAHWLKEISPSFYILSKRHHQQLEVDFEWKGMERAVGIVAPNREGMEKYYCIAMKNDFSVEERFAQAGGGIMKVVDKNKYEVDVERAAKARAKLNEMCSKYFCILNG